MLQFSEKLLNNLMQIGLTVSLAALVPLILRRLMKKRYPARDADVQLLQESHREHRR